MFRNFFGPPGPDRFAAMVLKALRAVGDKRPATYVPEHFRIEFSDGDKQAGFASLRNLYQEYCRVGRWRRRAWLRRTCAALAHHMDLPEEFEDVRPDLFPTVRTRSFVELMEIDARVKGDKPIELATAPLNDMLLVCLVYDLPHTMQFVTREQLEKWGTAPYEALEVARQNLDEKPAQVLSAGDRLFIFESGDAYDGTRLLRTDALRRLPPRGDPVAMPVTRNCLLVTGADDDVGLGMLADLAALKVEDPRPLCSVPFRLAGDDWEPWLPPADHPSHEKLRELRLRYFATEYAEQKAALDKLHDKEGPAVLVATLIAERQPGGPVRSFSTWTKGAPTWLPETDQVGFVDMDDKSCLIADWDRAIAEMGQAVKRLDVYPPRWAVETFPTAEQLQRMGAERLGGRGEGES